MTIHIKDEYQPQRELTVDQVNLELQEGTISTHALAWTPGMEEWVPVLSVPHIQAPLPPALPIDKFEATSKPESQPSTQSESPVSGRKWNIWSILAKTGIVVGYVTLAATTISVALHPDKNEYARLWAAICSICLFRRMLRTRSEKLLLQKPQWRFFSHYCLSYISAFWRWFLVFMGIVVFACFSVETAANAGEVFGRSIVYMIIGMIFAIDIPFRVLRAHSKRRESKFKQHNRGWIVFLFAVPLLLIIAYASSLKPRNTQSGLRSVINQEEYASPDQVWKVCFPDACTVKSGPLDIGIGEALRTIYSVDKGSCYYAVETIKYPQELLTRTGPPSLDRGRDGVLAATGGSLLAERDVYLNGLTGKEISILSKSKRFYTISRIFLKNETLYSVITVSSKDQDPDSHSFLNSFSFK